MDSDMPAWLSLKAPALAWPGAALAFKIFKLSCGPKPGQSQGSAQPIHGFQEIKNYKYAASLIVVKH